MLYICEVGVLEGHDKRVGVGRKRVGWALGLHKGGPKWGMWGGISRNCSEVVLELEEEGREPRVGNMVSEECKKTLETFPNPTSESPRPPM